MAATKSGTHSVPSYRIERTEDVPGHEPTASMLQIVEIDFDIVADDERGVDPYNRTGQFCKR